MQENEHANDEEKAFRAEIEDSTDAVLRDFVMISAAQVDADLSRAFDQVERMNLAMQIAKNRGLKIETEFGPLALAFVHAVTWRSKLAGPGDMDASTRVSTPADSVLLYLDSVDRLRKRAEANVADVSYHLRALELLDAQGINPELLPALPSLQGVCTRLSRPAADVVAALTSFCLEAGSED